MGGTRGAGARCAVRGARCAVCGVRGSMRGAGKSRGWVVTHRAPAPARRGARIGAHATRTRYAQRTRYAHAHERTTRCAHAQRTHCNAQRDALCAMRLVEAKHGAAFCVARCLMRAVRPAKLSDPRCGRAAKLNLRRVLIKFIRDAGGFGANRSPRHFFCSYFPSTSPKYEQKPHAPDTCMNRKVPVEIGYALRRTAHR